MALEEIGLRLTADGVVQTTTGVNLSGKAVEDLGKKADVAARQVATVGVSARQTANAMRQLPAQMTDIVTSLASGQSAFLVAIQQGGQIKDSFGGAVPALRAVAGALGPVGALSLGAAAAVGVLGLAHLKAEREVSSFTAAVVLSGNAAGVTVNGLSSMARELSGIAGRSDAAPVLAQLAASGAVSAQSMKQVATVALEMERVTGRAAADTVKEFVELGRAPVEASRKLNDQTNYLTAAVYEQIKALQEQGRTEEAALLAQRTRAEFLARSLPELKQNLGDLQRAWLAVGGAAMSAWNRMMNMGRQQDLDERLAYARELLAQARQRSSANPERESGYRTAERAAAADVARMEAARAFDQVVAEQEARRAGEEKRRIVAIDYLDRAEESAMTNAQRRAKLLAEFKRNQVAAGRADDKRALAEQEAYLARAFPDPKAPKATKKQEQPSLIINGRQASFRQEEIATYDEIDRAMRQRRLETMDRERKDREQAEREELQARQRRVQAAQRDAEALRQEAEAMAQGTEEIGLSSQALVQLRLRRLDDAIAQRQQALARVEGLQGYEDEAAAIREQIRLLDQLKGGTNARAAAEDRAEQVRASQDRSRTLADSIEQGLRNGFGAGRSIAEAFRNELIDSFARTVLRPRIIDPMAQSLTRGLDMLPSVFPEIFSIFGFHSGGVGPGEASFTRVPKFHGGTGPDELNAVIRRTEGVFTAGQMRAMAPLSDVRKAASEGGGGTVIHFSPQVNVDARTDRGEVLALVNRAMQTAQAQLLDKMDRRMA